MLSGRTLTNDDLRARISELQEDGSEEALQEAEHLQGVIDEVCWTDNPQYIREDYFFDGFAQDYADGLGPVTGWPYDYINWERATMSLAMDFKTIDICGRTYYVRS